jgi:integrase
VDKKAIRTEIKKSWWVLHDLRRTAKSLMVRAGVRPDISERALGHVIAGVEGVYDQHTYDDEKADALNRLASLIDSILNPPKGNVVAISEGASRSRKKRPLRSRSTS